MFCWCVACLFVCMSLLFAVPVAVAVMFLWLTASSVALSQKPDTTRSTAITNHIVHISRPRHSARITNTIPLFRCCCHCRRRRRVLPCSCADTRHDDDDDTRRSGAPSTRTRKCVVSSPPAPSIVCVCCCVAVYLRIFACVGFVCLCVCGNLTTKVCFLSFVCVCLVLLCSRFFCGGEHLPTQTEPPLSPRSVFIAPRIVTAHQ